MLKKFLSNFFVKTNLPLNSKYLLGGQTELDLLDWYDVTSLYGILKYCIFYNLNDRDTFEVKRRNLILPRLTFSVHLDPFDSLSRLNLTILKDGSPACIEIEFFPKSETATVSDFDKFCKSFSSIFVFQIRSGKFQICEFEIYFITLQHSVFIWEYWCLGFSLETFLLRRSEYKQ